MEVRINVLNLMLDISNTKRSKQISAGLKFYLCEKWLTTSLEMMSVKQRHFVTGYGCHFSYEPCREKTGLQGFRQGPT